MVQPRIKFTSFPPFPSTLRSKIYSEKKECNKREPISGSKPQISLSAKEYSNLPPGKQLNWSAPSKLDNFLDGIENLFKWKFPLR
ncbi:hypothetical protein TNCV_799461 [Trichonephila clavipes]|nr:hypothetical protein TNCV_799461 [Trichonephila clavipes]